MFLEKRSPNENRMILEFLAPRILIAIEKDDGVIDLREMTEADGVTISMNGGMIQILVVRVSRAEGCAPTE